MLELTLGLNAVDVALAVPRIAVGVFFAISGAHKLCVPERHASLVRTLQADRVPAVGVMQWWVPSWEFLAGLGMVLGLASVPAAGILTVIMLVACWCEAGKTVRGYNPINAADKVDDYLYLPEVLYLVILSVTLLAGPGAYSLDHVLFRG